MMMEELLHEEFQAGKIDALRDATLDILDERKMLTDSTRQLIENTSDLELLKQMIHTAISCSNTEEFLTQFKE